MQRKTIPLVSVCMITYNHEKYIAQAIQSVVSQKTDFHFELIISNDTSTDNTDAVIHKQVALNKNPNLTIRYFNQESNLGMTDNFVFTLKQSSAKYISLLEGDDYWTDSSKLQKQVDYLENHPEIVISGHNAKILNDDNTFQQEKRIGEARSMGFSSMELMAGKQIITLTMCFRNVIKEFPPEFYKSLNADSFLVSLLGQYGGSKFHTDISDGVYRLHSGGVWSLKTMFYQRQNQRNSYFQMFSYHKRMKNDFPAKQLFKKYYNVSKTLIGLYIDDAKHTDAVKTTIKVIFQCVKIGYFRRALSLTKFFYLKMK